MLFPTRPGLLAAVLLLGSATAADAQWWTADPAMAKYKSFGLPGTTPAAIVYDREKLNQANAVIQRSLETGEFAIVERMHDEFAQTKLRTTGGTWMIESVQWAFDAWFSSRDDARIRKLFEDWKRALPESKLRPVAEAHMWQRTAWKARGGRVAGQTQQEAIEIFRERMAKAAAAVEDSAKSGAESPIWHWVRLIVAGSTGQPVARFDASFEEAVSRFPTYHPLYSTRINYLLPQWGGNYDQVDQFVEASVARTAATEGRSFYAWLYADIAPKHSGDDFLTATRVSWPAMKASFEDLVRRYPDERNKAMFAAYACHARDRETAAKMLAAVNPTYPLEAFPGARVNGEACRRFAFDRT